MFLVSCPCCSAPVEASDLGFSDTTVSVAPCPTQAAAGVVSTRMRKSAAYAAALPAPGDLRHHEGLVTFGGAA